MATESALTYLCRVFSTNISDEFNTFCKTPGFPNQLENAINELVGDYTTAMANVKELLADYNQTKREYDALVQSNAAYQEAIRMQTDRVAELEREGKDATGLENQIETIKNQCDQAKNGFITQLDAQLKSYGLPSQDNAIYNMLNQNNVEGKKEADRNDPVQDKNNRIFNKMLLLKHFTDSTRNAFKELVTKQRSMYDTVSAVPSEEQQETASSLSQYIQRRKRQREGQSTFGQPVRQASLPPSSAASSSSSSSSLVPTQQLVQQLIQKAQQGQPGMDDDDSTQNNLKVTQYFGNNSDFMARWRYATQRGITKPNFLTKESGVWVFPRENRTSMENWLNSLDDKISDEENNQKAANFNV